MDYDNNTRWRDKLPNGYLEKGYFDSEGEIFEMLLTDTASKVAKSFGKGMRNSQLRRFYQHAKAADNAYSYHNNKRRLINDIITLDPFAAEAKGKDKIPEIFYEFIHKNIMQVNTVEEVRKGFLPHFQAVVAYFTYHYPKSN